MNSEIFKFVNIIKALIPEGTTKSIKLDDVEYSISNKDGVISLTQEFDDHEIKEYVSKFKEEIKKISDCDFVKMVENFKQDTKEFDNLLKLEHYSEEDSDKVLEMISNFSEIACKHLSEKIDKLVDLHETFNDFTR